MSSTATAPRLVDLRAFAAAASPALAGDWQAARTKAPVPDGAMRIEALVLDAGHGIATAGASEIVMVLDGTLSLTADSMTLRLVAGESAAIPQSSTFHWRTNEMARAIVVSSDCAAVPAARITRIDLDARHEPSAKPNIDLVVGDKAPRCKQHVDFRSADTSFYCGTWSSTPYHRLPMRYAHWEVMQLLEGEVAFGDADGRETLVGPGDIVVIPAGSVASWRAIGATRKLFAICRP